MSTASPIGPGAESADSALGPIARILVRLAGTPDDASDVDEHLVRIAELAAANLSAVAYASTTALRADAYTTVAATSALASAVDDAQYAAGSGPCLEALVTGVPVTVDDVTTTMKWPGFRQTAHRLGLRSSLSIPLFAGRGDAVASMNLYGRDTDAMADLAECVRAAFDASTAPVPSRRDPATGAPVKGAPASDAPANGDPATSGPATSGPATGGPNGGPATSGPARGSADLAAGLVEALAVRDRIQRAIGIVVQRERCSPQDAYLSLRVGAADVGVSLPDMATRMVGPG